MTRRERAACWGLTLLLGTLASATGEGEHFQFHRANATYSNPDPQLAPVERGPMTLRLRSPSNSVDLLEHDLVLRPLGKGVHAAALRVELTGEGDLEADLMISGVATQLKDKVVLPRQTLLLEGEIRLDRVENGYRITAVRLQPEIKLRIESQLAGSLVSTCKRFSVLIPLGSSCLELERSLTEAAVPLPQEGETFLLGDPLLTPEDRHQLDAYLTRADGPSPPPSDRR